MARARILKPGFFTNEDLCELPPFARLLFAGLWTIADSKGRLDDRPKRIKAELFPYDKKVDVALYIDALEEKGFIHRYQIQDARFIQIVKWEAHQHPHRNEAASLIPAPWDELQDGSGNYASPRDIPEDDNTDVETAPAVVVGNTVVVSNTVVDPVSKSVSALPRETDLPPSFQGLKSEIENSFGLGFIPLGEVAALQEFCRVLPTDWIKAGIKQTKAAQRPSWAYLKSILHGCVETGDPPSSIKPKPPPAPERPKSLRYQEAVS